MYTYTHIHTYTYVIFQKEMHNLTFSCLLSMKLHLIFLAQHFKTRRCHSQQLDSNRFGLRNDAHLLNSVQDNSEELKKHLEERKLEVRNNSKSTQLNSDKNSSTGYTGDPAPVHPKATGCTGALGLVHLDSAARTRVKNISCTGYTGDPMTKHRSIHHVILQRACFRVRNFASAPVHSQWH